MSETNQGEVNSESYWDNRFGADWETSSGRQQTAFFARVALHHLPAWFARDVRRDSLTFCDWGCAEGDGVDVLAAGLQVPVIGIDFAASAIEKASAFYPARQFMQSDFLAGDTGLRFDVVFSSNTLEHFAEPWRVFVDIAKHANKYVVLLLPFQEYERHFEHFATFDFDCIPLDIAGFNLVHGQVIDTGAMTPNYWPGKQVLLIYARREMPGPLRLVLSDVLIDHAGHLATQHALIDAQATLAQAQAVVLSQANAISVELDALRAAQQETQTHLALMQSEAEDARQRKLEVDARYADLARERDSLVSEQARLAQERDALKSKIVASDEAHERDSVMLADLAGAREAARAAQADLDKIRYSVTWRLTWPVRALVHMLSGRGKPPL